MRNRHGFTLVELLVVVAIIGVLVALLLPAVQAAREAARRAHCSNNLKQIGLALQNFHSARKTFPPGQVDNDNNNYGWAIYILPYLEERPTYDLLTGNGVELIYRHGKHKLRCGGGENIDECDNEMEVSKNHAGGICKNTLNVFMCPTDVLPDTDDDGYGKSNYCANLGWSFGSRWGCSDFKGKEQNGILLFDNDDYYTWLVKIADITDGTSKTIIVGEVTESEDVSGDGSSWHFPIWPGGNNDGQCDVKKGTGSFGRIVDTDFFINRRTSWESDLSFGSQHFGGALFAFADGSVHYLDEDIDTDTYRKLGSRNDHEPVTLP